MLFRTFGGKKVLLLDKAKLAEISSFVDMVDMINPCQVFIKMMTQKFEGLFFTTFTNSRDGLTTNKELSKAEMAALNCSPVS